MIKDNINKHTSEIEISTLNAVQKRHLIRLVKLLIHTMESQNEADFINGSAESMRLCAALIKNANFPQNADNQSIPYGDQAIEFSLEKLEEQIQSQKIVSYEN